MKSKQDGYERALKNMIATVFLTHEIGKVLHLKDIYRVLERTPRFRSERNLEENIRDKLRKDDIFIKVNPNIKDGLYKLDEDFFK